MDKEIKLHLGCFNKKLHNWTNIDARKEVEPDLVEDVFTLPSFKPCTVSKIYFCHGIEHGNYSQVRAALLRYYELLKPTGELRLSVPDMEAAFAAYYYHNRDLNLIRSMLSGSQRHPFDVHYSHWDYDTLTQELSFAGFNQIERYDPRTIEPTSWVDDYSSAVLPFRDLWKEDRTPSDAKLMSLNLRAWK